MEELDPVETATRRTLASLDGLAVPALASIEARSARARPLGLGRAVLAVCAVLVAAVLLGDALNAWRAERSAAAPTATAVSPAAGTLKPDARYGLLVRRPDKTVALVDELGTVFFSIPDSIEQAKTSPNGRYIALWSRRGDGGSELRIVDGVTRTLGAALFSTTEKFPGQNEGIVWASDSSAVLVASTADPVAGASSPLDVNLRAVTLSGVVRRVATYHTFIFAPLAWDRAANVISAYAFERFQPSTGGTKFLRFADDGTGRVDSVDAADSPMAADAAGKYVIASIRCPGTSAGCRKFAVHDVATYAVIGQIDLPPLLLESGYWAIRFVPRSSDILTDFSRTLGGANGRFGLELYGDAGRGARRDLGDTVSAPINGLVVSPNAFVRADGSAVLVLHTRNDGSGDWIGDIVDLSSASHGPITTQQPLATIVLDPTLVPAAVSAPAIDDPYVATIFPDSSWTAVRPLPSRAAG